MNGQSPGSSLLPTLSRATSRCDALGLGSACAGAGGFVSTFAEEPCLLMRSVPMLSSPATTRSESPAGQSVGEPCATGVLPSSTTGTSTAIAPGHRRDALR
eukprot:5124601-Prymnesium_polylepis.1